MEQALLQYGFIGIALIALARFSYEQYRSLLKKNNNLELKVDSLQSELKDFIKSDRESMIELIAENNRALKDLHDIINIFIKKN